MVVQTFREFFGKKKPVTEAVTVDTERYVNTHGKKPSGKGTWYFGAPGEPGTYQAPRGTTFQQAARSAKEWAREKGYPIVYVMT
jgi:hypothetical protein